MRFYFAQRRFLLFVILVGVFGFGVFVGNVISGKDLLSFFKARGESFEHDLEISSLQAGEMKVDLAIDYGNGDIQSFPGEVLLHGANAHDLLHAIERRYGIPIEVRNFPGLGVFVESIHGVRNTNTSYWQYWVNDTYAQIGASGYILKEGDKVLWKRTNQREPLR